MGLRIGFRRIHKIPISMGCDVTLENKINEFDPHHKLFNISCADGKLLFQI